MSCGSSSFFAAVLLPVALTCLAAEETPQESSRALEPSHYLVVRGGEGQNGEDGFRVDHQKVLVREDVECAMTIPSPKSEDDEELDTSSLRGDAELIADIKGIWERSGEILRDLRTLGLNQTADLLAHYLYKGRLNWCFTEFDLREVNDVGEHDSVVDFGNREGMTVGVNQNDFVYLSLPAWKAMERESSKRKTFLHEMFWSVLRDGRVVDVNTVVKFVNHFDDLNLAASNVENFIFKATQLLPSDSALILKLMKNDLELSRMTEGSAKAKIVARLSLRAMRPSWKFIQILSLTSPDSAAPFEVSGSNPKDRYHKIFLGENKVVNYEGTNGRVYTRDRKDLDDLCYKSVDESGNWRLMNELEFDLLVRSSWPEFLVDPLQEEDLVLVSTGSGDSKSIKAIDQRSRSDRSSTLTAKNPKYLKYFCVKQN